MELLVGFRIGIKYLLMIGNIQLQMYLLAKVFNQKQSQLANIMVALI